jgi:hypothetical protein
LAIERLRRALADDRLDAGGQPLPIEASLGLAAAIENESIESLAHRADAARYAAETINRRKSWFHNGITIAPIESELRTDRRYNFATRQRLAPCIDGRIPSLAEFVEVQCEDLSAGGFSCLLEFRPNFEHLAVALGAPDHPWLRTARIKNCAEVIDGGRRLFRIGCVFTRPISADELTSAAEGSNTAQNRNSN